MAKFKFHVGIGYVGMDREEIVEIPDQDFENLTKEEKEKFIENEFNYWMNENIDYGWYRSEDNANAYIMYLSTGYHNGEREEEIEFDEGVLDTLTTEEIDSMLEEEFHLWKWNYLDTSWKEI